MILAMLVAFLAAAAKYSQFEGAPQHGYLSKAVKMEGTRTDIVSAHDAAPSLPVRALEASVIWRDAEPRITAAPVFLAVSLSSHPLRS